MGWLIDLLVEGIKEKCSQFIIDMMEIITNMFTELLSCDLNLFEELFGVVGDLYKNVIVPLAIALLLLICVWQLFKSMFGKLGLNSEDPFELICRSGACLFLILGAKSMVNYILAIAGTPYQWVVGTDVKVSSFSEYVSSLEGATSVLGIDSISTMLLMLIMQFVVAWNYFKMLFVVAERYVLLGVFSYTAPLALATGGSKATNSILASWSKMFGGQVVLIILNAWSMRMFLSGYGNMLASGYGFTKFFAATLCLVGFCKIVFKLDTYMASLGVNLGRPSNGIGAMGLIMAAGRLFSHVGRGGASGGSPSAAPSGGGSTPPDGDGGGMRQGMGTPIPMSDGGMRNSDSNHADQTKTNENRSMDDGLNTQEASMENMDGDNVLETLGETAYGGGRGADATATSSSTADENANIHVDSGIPAQQKDNGVIGDENALTEAPDSSTGEMRLDEGQRVGYPGSERENGFSAGEQEIGYSNDESEIGYPGGSQEIHGEETGDTIAELLNEEGSIGSLGDYPVDRKELGMEEENVDTEMDLEGGVITEDSSLSEATCGSAGSAFEGRETIAGSSSGKRLAGEANTGIMSELGAVATIEGASSLISEAGTGKTEFGDVSAGAELPTEGSVDAEIPHGGLNSEHGGVGMELVSKSESGAETEVEGGARPDEMFSGLENISGSDRGPASAGLGEMDVGLPQSYEEDGEISHAEKKSGEMIHSETESGKMQPDQESECGIFYADTDKNIVQPSEGITSGSNPPVWSINRVEMLLTLLPIILMLFQRICPWEPDKVRQAKIR